MDTVGDCARAWWGATMCGGMAVSMSRGSIYRATCKTSGKAYIGQTRDSNGVEARRKFHIRLSRDAGCRTIFHRAIAKYGPDDFGWEVLSRHGVEDLDAAETAAIALHGTVTPAGYNIRSGPSGVRGVTGGAYTRRKHPEEGLPAGVTRYIKNGAHVGYQATYGGTTRVLITPHLSLERKRESVVQWMNDRRHGIGGVTARTRKPGNGDLPHGIYRLKTSRKVFQVNMRGHKQMNFATLAEAIAQRGLYLGVPPGVIT